MCHNTLLDGWLCSCQLIYWTWSICQKEKVWTGGSCLIVSICLISWVLPTDLESKVLYSKSSKLMHFRDVATFNNECATNIILVVSNIVIFGALLWSWTLIPKKWPVKRTGCERVLVWLMSILKFYLQVLKNTCFNEKYAYVITSGTVRIHIGSCYGCDLYNYFEIRYIDYHLTSALSCLEHSNV